MNILNYYASSSIGSTQTEPEIESAPAEIEAAPEPQPEHEGPKPEPQSETGPQIDESNATTFDESTNQPSQLISEFHLCGILYSCVICMPLT